MPQLSTAPSSRNAGHYAKSIHRTIRNIARLAMDIQWVERHFYGFEGVGGEIRRPPRLSAFRASVGLRQ
jgi:hypothetical protein